MGGFLKALLAVPMFLFGLLLMAAGLLGLMSQPGEEATSIVTGGFGVSLVLLAAWLASGSLKALLVVLMFLFGVLLMAAGFFGLMSQAPLTQPGDEATSIVMGGFGFFLVLLAVVWRAVK